MTNFKIGDIVKLQKKFVDELSRDPNYFMYLVVDVNLDKTYSVIHLWTLNRYDCIDMEMYQLA